MLWPSLVNISNHFYGLTGNVYNVQLNFALRSPY